MVELKQPITNPPKSKTNTISRFVFKSKQSENVLRRPLSKIDNNVALPKFSKSEINLKSVNKTVNKASFKAVNKAIPKAENKALPKIKTKIEKIKKGKENKENRIENKKIKIEKIDEKENLDYDSDKENRGEKRKTILPQSEIRRRALRPIHSEFSDFSSDEENDIKDKNKIKTENEIKSGKSNWKRMTFELLPSSSKCLESSLKSIKSKKYPFDYNKDNFSKLPFKTAKIPLLKNSKNSDQKTAKKFEKCENYILIYLLKTEFQWLSDKNCVDRQNDISQKMRSILLDWLAEVRDSFRLQFETLFLAVKLIDCFLAKSQSPRREFQLLGCAAMFVAAKFCEISPPVAKDFVYVANKSFEVGHLLKMEIKILKLMNWSLTPPPHRTLLNYVLDLVQATKIQRNFASFIIELSLFECSFNEILPSKLCSAAVFLALHVNESPRQSTFKEDAIWRNFLAPKNIKIDKNKKNCEEKNGKEFLAWPRLKNGAERKIGVHSKRIIKRWESNPVLKSFYSSYQLKKEILCLVELVKNPNNFEYSIRRKFSMEEFCAVSKIAAKTIKRVEIY